MSHVVYVMAGGFDPLAELKSSPVELPVVPSGCFKQWDMTALKHVHEK